MTPWAPWLTLLLLLLALAGVVMLHRLLRTMTRQVAALQASVQHDHTTLLRFLASLEAQALAPKPEPWLGAFLPTDAHAAALERQIRESEDHAISAAGPIPFLSGTSPRSAKPSAPGRSTPPARTSGAR